jgi:23S rRNA-/tRNA-specific pseudouridylate synthase
LGDPQYGTEESQKASAELGLTSQILCAKQIDLMHPVTGTPLQILSKMDGQI